ncbi:MAG: NTP transferase domain-containing protein, partial [Microbacterium sp.]
PWVARLAAVLADASCAPVLVALGAARDEAAPLVPAAARIVEVAEWAEGLSATLRAALRAAEATDATAALVVPVDVSDLPVSVCRRVLDAGAGPERLARAVFGDAPGHPVLLGRAHWARLAAQLEGDRGAGGYLAAHDAARVRCEDLWDGADHDVPPDYAPSR